VRLSATSRSEAPDQSIEMARGNAYLIGTNLQKAVLFGAILKDANLRGADLRDAKSLTQDQIDSAHIDDTTKCP
jgi:uncharacterized protein YjbI with pentapeptide repeats